MTPRISVITPAYNRLDLIQETLDSVFGQSLGDLEYILVDDGSSDGTFEWLEGVQDPRLRLLTHPERQNRGQAASINLGLEQARGEFVVILDSDDLLAPGALEAHAAMLEQNPALGMVYGQGYAIDVDGHRLYPLFPEGHRETSEPDRLLLDCYVASPGLCMFRKSVIDEVGPLEVTFRAAQDHDFLLRVAEKAPVGYSGVTSFYYRKHDGSISTNGQRTRWQNGFEILHRAKARYPYKKSTLRKRKAVLCFRLGMVLLKEGRQFQGVRYLLESGLRDPARALAVLLGRERVH